MSDLKKYFKQIAEACPGVSTSDVFSIGESTFKAVDQFLTTHNAVKANRSGIVAAANESLSLDTAVQAVSITGLKNLVESCGVGAAYVKPACEAVLNIMDRMLGGAAWVDQSKQADHTDGSVARNLASMYSSDITGILSGNQAPGQEAFGVNVDMAVPDMKVAITVAIMNFHTRLVPRMFPTRTTSQPNVSYTKETLEVYDLSGNTGDRAKLIDLYADPMFAKNELKRIVARQGKDPEGKFLVADGILKFGVKANLLRLSINEDLVGYEHINRTDLIAENVLVDFVRVKLSKGEDSAFFDVKVPMSQNRLTRMVNANDSAMRNADINFRAMLGSDAKDINGEVPAFLADLANDSTGNASIVLDMTVKPTVSLKYGDANCLGSVQFSIRHDEDNAALTAAQSGAVTGVELVGYSLDARFSEENLRKTCVAVMSHRQPFSFDIPIGRNYVFDYAIGQTNAEENATNLTKVIGIGQDRIALDIAIRTLEDVNDRLKVVGSNPVDAPEYVGTNYVAGDKVRPSIFIGTLDLSKLNIIRDADRAGDIKQKAISMLTAATSKILQESYLQQQLGGSTTVTFRAITSIEVLGNVIGMPHIHDHMNKEDARNVGDGVEYVLVLPNGVKIEFITSTFTDMRAKMVMWPIIAGNGESELNFAHNWDYGTMVAHYTPSGQAAHHRLFANIRELPIVTNPVGLIIDVKGMDIANGIAIDGVVRPTAQIEIDGVVTTKVQGTVTTSGDAEAEAAAGGEGGEQGGEGGVNP